MKKIHSLFQRNYDGDRLVRDEVVPGSEWVVAGEGVATRKFDGTCCRIQDGRLYKRYDAKKGVSPPPEFEPAQDPDPITGHWPGWVPVGEGSEDLWHREAFDGQPDGTYELVGPKINRNPEGFDRHVLVRHGEVILPDCPRDFEGLKQYLADRDIEGIVWRRFNGDMVKIKKKDFHGRR